MKNPIPALMRVLTCAFASPNPSVVHKRKVIDTYAAEAVAAGDHNGASHEMPRGATNIRMSIEDTLFDATTGAEDYQFRLQTRAGSGDSWRDVPGMEGTLREGVTSGDEVVPSAANAPGVAIDRFVRAQLTTIGNTPIATATIALLYDVGEGPGLEHRPEYKGG